MEQHIQELVTIIRPELESSRGVQFGKALVRLVDWLQSPPRWQDARYDVTDEQLRLMVKCLSTITFPKKGPFVAGQIKEYPDGIQRLSRGSKYRSRQDLQHVFSLQQPSAIAQTVPQALVEQQACPSSGSQAQAVQKQPKRIRPVMIAARPPDASRSVQTGERQQLEEQTPDNILSMRKTEAEERFEFMLERLQAQVKLEKRGMITGATKASLLVHSAGGA